MPELTRIELKREPDTDKAGQTAAPDISGTFHIRTFADSWSGGKLHIVSFRSSSTQSPLGPHSIGTYYWEGLEGPPIKSPERWVIPPGADSVKGGNEWYFLADFMDGPISMKLLRACLKVDTSKAARGADATKPRSQVKEAKDAQALHEEYGRIEGRGHWLPEEYWDALCAEVKEKEQTIGWPLQQAYWGAQDASEDESESE